MRLEPAFESFDRLCILDNVFTTKNITYRRRSFAVAGPTLWNSLPFEIRSSSSLPMFRSRLKTFLFREAYTISAP